MFLPILFAFPTNHFSITEWGKLNTYVQETVPVNVILSENPILLLVSVLH